MSDKPDTVEWRCKICGRVDAAADHTDAELMLALHIKAKHPAEDKKQADARNKQVLKDKRKREKGK